MDYEQIKADAAEEEAYQRDPIVHFWNQIDETTAVLGGVDPKDYPDFSDAYVESICWQSGIELTEDELDQFSEQLDEIAQRNAFESLL